MAWAARLACKTLGAQAEHEEDLEHHGLGIVHGSIEQQDLVRGMGLVPSTYNQLGAWALGNIVQSGWSITG